jgi:hypothetical protein
MDRALSERVETNRKEYNRLLKDSNYIDVRFNEKNGGLSAIHKEHSFDSTVGKFGIPRGEYERISLDVLYDYGRGVVLESEKSKLNKKFSEGFLDGIRFDIKGIEGIGGRNIIDKISHASRQGAESVVLYFHDKNLFDRKKIVNAYKGYLKLSKTKQVKTIYYIVDNKLHKLE